MFDCAQLDDEQLKKAFDSLKDYNYHDDENVQTISAKKLLDFIGNDNKEETDDLALEELKSSVLGKFKNENELNFEQFKIIYSQNYKNIIDTDDYYLEKCFKFIDKNQKGYLVRKELQSAFKLMKIPIKNDVDLILNDKRMSNRDMFTLEDFKRFVTMSSE